MKVIIEGFCFINVRIAALVHIFNVGKPILSVLFCFTYDPKHFGFSIRLLPIILLI